MGSLSDIKPVVRLSLTNPDSKSHSEYGRGIASLCQGIQEKGSLYAAAKEMGMAYSKAWRIIRDTEATLDITILCRDGAHGSSLTEEGLQLLEAYNNLDRQIQIEAEKLFGTMVE